MLQCLLPVYQHKEEILRSVTAHQVLIVESPTGSGKTTQIPIILHQSGLTDRGIIGVTQPRRIAAVGVSHFIQQQLGDIVAYKMRFGDTTTPKTKIKIVTDGILLQELHHDPLLKDYTLIMVDEAHERTLNIDFLLGLLKYTLSRRPDFKVIISSATLNTNVFSRYFNNAPILHIDAITHPVTVLYNAPAHKSETALLDEIVRIVEKVILKEKRKGGILIFLQGERYIKECLRLLRKSRIRHKIWALPLYGMLVQEEQEKVFNPPPRNKIKIVVSTNIAETSITIDNVTTVIDSGLCKENTYHPVTCIATLMERPISQASADQRKGRAGRTAPGSCYRLYSKEDYMQRPDFTTEEIYRTDLSEVVLRMAGLGIQDFAGFDFISRPLESGIFGAIATLKLLEALDKDNKLTNIGSMMLAFPLLPRHARILVEAILHFPGAIYKCCIITSFLSTNSPFVLTEGRVEEARQAHRSFSGEYGDFSRDLNLFAAYIAQKDKDKFAQRYHLDKRTMDEIVNIQAQLEGIVTRISGFSFKDDASMQDVLTCCAKGLVQYLCARIGNGVYRSTTAKYVFIHPGAVIEQKKPRFIMAGEIVQTTRLYACHVAPLGRNLAPVIYPEAYRALIDSIYGNLNQTRAQETEEEVLK